MLSPQHWAKSANDNSEHIKGTWQVTYDDQIELHWSNNKFQKTIILDSITNEGRFQSAPGFQRFMVHNMLIQPETSHVCCFDANLVSDDEQSITLDTTVKDCETTIANEIPTQLIPTLDKNLSKRTGPHVINFHDEDQLDYKETNSVLEHQLAPMALLLRLYYQMSHLSFRSLRLMAENGHLSRKIMECPIPKCTACMFGRATRRPWRTKSTINAKIKITTQPGQCVSVDQLESPTPGLATQLRGIPTTLRYKAATIFVDHFSCMSNVHLQPTLSSQDTIKAKKAFEKFARSHGVIIKHYHADNGRFADNAFIADTHEQQQTITYCGVNAHFQNGIAEKRIRDLQYLTRTSLLHASNRWPKAIST